MPVTVTFEDFGAVVFARYQAAASEIVSGTAYAVRDHCLYLFREPKSGRIYHRPWGIHQASAPGEPPAIDTAELHDDMANNGVYEESPTEYRVGTDVPQGEWMQFGTARILPRPWLDVATEAERRNFENAVRELVG